jgi:hypothetical protein
MPRMEPDPPAWCTAAARLARNVAHASVRRSGAFVLDTGARASGRVVLTIPAPVSDDAVPTLDVFDRGGFLRSHELDAAGARVVYAILLRGRALALAEERQRNALVDDTLVALARWHDRRARRTMRILGGVRPGTTAHEITNADHASASSNALTSIP